MTIIRRATDIPSSEITAESGYLTRRGFIARAGGVGVALASASALGLGCSAGDARAERRDGRVADSSGGTLPGPETPNSYEDITSYNNYYEFGTDKSDPKENSQRFRTRPWTVEVDG